MKLLPNITIRVPPVAGPVVGNTSLTTGGGGAGEKKENGAKPKKSQKTGAECQMYRGCWAQH